MAAWNLSGRGLRAALALALLALHLLAALGRPQGTVAAGLTTQSLGLGLTAQGLASTLLGAGLTVSNVTYQGADRAAGTFAGGGGIVGFDSGVILSSGGVAGVVGPNTSSEMGASNTKPGDTQLDALANDATRDAAVLEFDFVPSANSVIFQYVFGSEEYNEFVDSEFNDVFAFYINGTNCALVDGQPVSINTINGNKNGGLFINNALNTTSSANLNTELDGLTRVLLCQASVNPGVANHIKLAIADTADFIYDSDVFIRAASLTTGYQATVTATGGGAVIMNPPGSGSGPFGYPVGTVVTLTAQPSGAGGAGIAASTTFVGWTIDGAPRGWANPATITMDVNHTIQATFVPTPTFGDVTGTTPHNEAITLLAARGVIKGCDQAASPPLFCPTDRTVRAQMSALIARAVGWDAEDHGNTFPDDCLPGVGCIDAALWRNVGTLQFYGVAKGYPDGTYNPFGEVLHAQTISFITRAMVKKGYWTQATLDDGTVYPNIPATSGHRLDFVTYTNAVGPVPGTATTAQTFDPWDQPSTRSWFAQALWQALNGYFGVDQPGKGGYLP